MTISQILHPSEKNNVTILQRITEAVCLPVLKFQFLNLSYMKSNLYFFTFLIFLINVHTALGQPKWKLARSPLATPWTDKVSPDNVLKEYPRPQMTRTQWQNLNGEWGFKLADKKAYNVVKRGRILVPFPVESALSGIKKKVEPDHLMSYNRSFSVPSEWRGQRVLLHFGAVDYEMELFVNTKRVGEHKGGYAPFYFDITDYLNEGDQQQLTVQVTDPTDSGGQPIGKQRLDPSGIFYTATSGIWQTVWLEPVPKAYIKSYRAEPNVDKSHVLVRVETEGENKNKAMVTARIMKDGQKVSESKGRAGTPLLLHIRKDLRLWSPDDPYLYELEISLGNKNTDDKVEGYFGMRKIEVDKTVNGDNRLFLNDKPLFQIGVLDQGFWPDGLYTPPSEEAMIFDLQTMKDMGFNLIRKHVKIEPARWYHLCDKMGLLVWQDMPSAANKSEADQKQFKWELKDMVDNLFNFPSIIMWVPFNEEWGQHDTQFYVERMKEWDPTRLVNNASGWTDKGVGDVLDIHAYPGPAAPPQEANRAIVLGEFGGLGLNVRGHKWSDTGWGYQLIETSNELLYEYEQLWWKLHQLQDTAGLSAVVYTQLSDIETENNGLLTYDRKLTKIEASLVAAAHKGLLPPKPKNDARIFVKKAAIELMSTHPDAAISYTLDGHAADAKWRKYKNPVSLKKSGSIRTRATWSDGTQSHTQEYVYKKTKPLKSKVPKDASTDITLKVFDGPMEKLPDFKTLTPSKTLTVNDFSLDPIGQGIHYAALFETYIDIPETGVYTFYLTSDDGSSLHVANQLLIDNDGVHGMKPMSGSIALKKGKHPLRLAFFQNEGGQGLEFKWE